MIKRFSRLRRLGAALLLAGVAQAGAAQPFDHYLLALSWSPSWCAAASDRDDAEQCDPDRDLGFVLHGLWPQYETGGWPEFCTTSERDATRAQTRAMADIMGSSGLAWYQWKKHGRCAGLSAGDYFDAARLAFGLTRLPIPARRMSAAALVDAFVAANPGLGPDELVVTCRDGRLQEVRLCLTTGLEPRACSAEVRDDACRTRGPLDLPPAP